MRCALKVLEMKHGSLPDHRFKAVLLGTWVDTEVEINDEV